MKYKFLPQIIIRIPQKPQRNSFTEKDIRLLFKKPEYSEALLLSSPVLLNENKKFNNKGKSEKEKNLLVLSLAKYALRMHNRCTPFGLFAGCGICNLEQVGEVVIKRWFRHTNLDMNYIFSLAQELTNIPTFKNRINFYPNNSIYSVLNELRYVDYFSKDGKRNYRICSVTNSKYLIKIINRAKKGATIQNLVLILIKNGIGDDEAYSFINELIESQLLVSELEPSILGIDALEQISITLEKICTRDKKPLESNILTTINEIKNSLLILDQKIGNDINVYNELLETIKKLNVKIIEGKILQTDLFFDVQKKVLPDKRYVG